MKTLIAVPCMSQVAAEFARSLALLKKGGDFDVQFAVDSLVYNARNDLANAALKQKAEYVLWLDSDMVFDPDLLERLLLDMREGRDIVSGLYFDRHYPYPPVILKQDGMEDGQPVFEVYADHPVQKLFRVDACGFGAVLMRTRVLHAVYEKYHNWFAPLIGYGEDISFCIRARECGCDIWCDPTIKPGLIGSVTVTERFYTMLRRKEGFYRDE